MTIHELPTNEEERAKVAHMRMISDTLVGARRDDSSLVRFPGELPSSLSEAYEIQSWSIGNFPDSVAGWKVGGVAPNFQKKFHQAWLVGPIFSQSIQRSKFAPVQMPAFRDGFVAVEAEFVLELKRVSGNQLANLTIDNVSSVVSNCYVGVEIASSPMPMINELGPAAIISDFGNNFGLVVGKSLSKVSSEEISRIQVLTHVNGQLVGQATAASTPSGPFGAVLFLLQNLAARGIDILEGTLVSTGAVTGVHELEIGSQSTVIFEGIDSIELEITPI